MDLSTITNSKDLTILGKSPTISIYRREGFWIVEMKDIGVMAYCDTLEEALAAIKRRSKEFGE